MRSNDPDETWICADCIGESFLRARIEADGHRCNCHYCGESNACFTLETVSDLTEKAIEEHYYRTSDEPTALDHAR